MGRCAAHTADAEAGGRGILPEAGPQEGGHGYLVSRCDVWRRQRGQNFDRSRRSGSFFRFFVVAYVRERQMVQASVMIGRLSFAIFLYSRTFVTTPAPTVRPPSRMAKRRPSSRAIGVMRVISRVTLSPGMTISVPAGSSAEPVTSVVRM
jgi:hypothetical protein